MFLYEKPREVREEVQQGLEEDSEQASAAEKKDNHGQFFLLFLSLKAREAAECFTPPNCDESVLLRMRVCDERVRTIVYICDQENMSVSLLQGAFRA